MSAVNSSISYQSQFAPSNVNLNDFLTERDAKTLMKSIKGIELEPISHKSPVSNVTLPGELGKNVNLRV
jgi:hypothetical protein